MSYLHCPTCKCAYNLAREPVCPRCGIRPGTGDPVDDVVAAAEQLARAIDRARPAELAVANARLAQRALPVAAGSSPATRPSLMIAVEAVRAALAPPPPAEATANRALLATVAVALLARLAAPRRTPVRWARSLFRAVSGSML